MFCRLWRTDFDCPDVSCDGKIDGKFLSKSLYIYIYITFNPKLNILSLVTHLHVVRNLYYIFLWNTNFVEECASCWRWLSSSKKRQVYNRLRLLLFPKILPSAVALKSHLSICIFKQTWLQLRNTSLNLTSLHYTQIQSPWSNAW